MTDTTLREIRAHHAALHAVYPDRYTAHEMALQSHNLNMAGSLATLPDGRRFIWMEHVNLWMAYRA
jgi:hypothetical protein